MLKQWLDAGKCLLGAHQGDWALEAHGECRVVQVCRICGQESRRIEHLWSPWSAAGPASCESTRACTRCSEAETRVEHDWSERIYRATDTCEQRQRCDRCGAWHDERRVVHDWDAWGYSETHRSPVRRCRRCGIGTAYFTGEIESERDAAPPALPPQPSAPSPFERGNTIVGEFIDAMSARGDSSRLAQESLAAAAAIDPLSGPDALMVSLWTSVRVLSVLKAYTVVDAARREGSDIPHATDIRELADAYERGERIELQSVLDAVRGLLENGHPDPTVLRDAVLPVLGLGLMFGRESLDVFDPLRDRLVALTLAANSPPPPAADAADRPSRTRYDAILDEYAATLARDGLSEYAMQQAINSIKELPDDPAEEPRASFEAMVRVYDISLPYASGDTAQVLQTSRQGLVQSFAALDDQLPPLTLAEIGPLAETILEDLETALAAGDAAGPCFARAMSDLQALGARVRDDADGSAADAKPLMAFMVRLFDIILRYAPEDSRHALEEMKVAMTMAASGLDLPDDDVAGRLILERQSLEQAARGMPTVDAWALRAAPDAAAHITQVAQLLPRVRDRLFDPGLGAGIGPGDQQELARLRDRIDSRWKVIRHATTEDQFLRPQRDGLRRASLEFHAFERRRHLMMVEPALPTHPVSLDGNRVFFSGSAPVEALVERTCLAVGLSVSPKHGLANRAHGRWQQLREAGMAICDYSAYDPAGADPRTATASMAEEDAVLRAAGPVASVAYETGWAYVLGKPVVTVSRRGRPVPFDIDVEPVLLEDTPEDGERLLAGIHAAFYGTPHGLPGNCLAETIDYARQRYGTSGDDEIDQLLAALSPDDATRARLTLEAIAARVDERTPLVTLPTFAGGYPSGHLFHVTAFREWTKAAQEETRAACERAGVEYRIGSDRLGADILRDVWNDICGASFIVADITHLNPNAVLELGIAHALGRRTLIVTQNRQAHAYLAAIEKVRVHHYDARGGAALASLLDRFLEQREAWPR